MEVLSRKEIDDLLNSIKPSEDAEKQEKLNSAEFVQLLVNKLVDEVDGFHGEEANAAAVTVPRATGKLTKLGKEIIGMGNKLRTNVANQWRALRNVNKKRKFLKWCKEQNILMVHVDGSVDYDELQRIMQDSISNIDTKSLAEMANNISVDKINENTNTELPREM